MNSFEKQESSWLHLAWTIVNFTPLVTALRKRERRKGEESPRIFVAPHKGQKVICIGIVE